MNGLLATLVVIVFAISRTESSSADSLFRYCPEPRTIESTSRLKRVWWSAPRIHHRLVSSMRRIGRPAGSTFNAGEHSVRYEAQGFDGSNCTCVMNFTVIVTECPPIPQIGASFLRCTNDNRWPSRCDFYCPSGYRLSSHSTTTCTKTGVWSPSTFPICQMIYCPHLRRPRNSMMTCQSNVIRQGTWCQFACTPGYKMSGSHVRTCVRNKWSGMQTTCEDGQPPIFHRCPPRSVRVTAQYGMGYKRVFYPMPFALDNKRPADLRIVSGQVSGSRFDIGSNLVHYTAVDSAGNVAHCRFSVNVVDNQPPRFKNCPKPIFIYSTPRTPSIVVNYTTPVAMDNSSPHPLNITKVLGRESGSIFSPGVYTVQYIANDDTGNYAECVFYIVVKVSSCNPLEESASVYRTCSRFPPYISGTWCNFSCMNGRPLVGSPTRSCGKDGWSGQPSICIGTVHGNSSEDTTTRFPPLPTEFDGPFSNDSMISEPIS